MPISIEGIKFNYDPEHLEKTGAINLRRNEKQPVLIPEWEPHRCGNHECSPVAYRMNALPETITIQASFYVEGDYRLPLRIKGAAVGRHLLGETAEVIIKEKGSSGFKCICLPKADVANSGVGVNDVSWRWQYADADHHKRDHWIEFQTTNHRVYSILDDPTCPWEFDSTNPTNIHLPWTEVLDHACKWAEGVKIGEDSLDKAATQLTIAVNHDLAPFVSEGSHPAFAGTDFNCTSFLALFRADKVTGRAINCDDTATIVSTFANVLGCSLSQSGMGYGFWTKEILVIGNPLPDIERYKRHAVAWKGECKNGDVLFDAFLQFQDKDPKGNQSLEVPVNVKFDDGRTSGYRNRLRESGNCVPQPFLEKKRRQLGHRVAGELPLTDYGLLRIVKDRYKFETWPADGLEFLTPKSIFSFGDLLVFSEGWWLESYRQIPSDRFKTITELILMSRVAEKQLAVAMTLYCCGLVIRPNEFIAELLTYVSSDDIEPFDDLGELAFADHDERIVIFRRHSYVCLVRSASKEPLQVTAFARVLDKFVSSAVD